MPEPTFLPIVLRKDGPTQTDGHVDKIIGAIHAFTPMGTDPRMCATCGLTRDTHSKSFSKQTGFDTPFPNQPASDEPAPPPDPLQAGEEQANNNAATDTAGMVPPHPGAPPSPLLWRFMGPNDDSTQADTPDGQTHKDPLLLNSDEAADLAESTPPPAFHEPFAKRAPRGMESGNVGEWVSPGSGNFVPQGELPRDDNGNIKQDGPIAGPLVEIAEAARNASPDVTTPRPKLHDFSQCPKCGVATSGTEQNCPNPWCSHNLIADGSASFDSWEEGVEKMIEERFNGYSDHHFLSNPPL